MQQTDYDGKHEEFDILAVAVLNDPDDVIHHDVYYTIDGIQVNPENLRAGIYLKQIIHLDGRIEFEKIFIQ